MEENTRTKREEQKSGFQVKKLAYTGVFAALCYIGFQFTRIDIAVGGGKTALHLGNAFLLVAALLLGPVSGGLAGAIGMTIADLTSGYAIYAPTTFLLKFCIGLIVGSLAMNVFKLPTIQEKGKAGKYAALSCAGGIVFNIVADPTVGYLYKRFILSLTPDAAGIIAKMSALTTFVNGAFAILVATLLYTALMPLRKKM